MSANPNAPYDERVPPGPRGRHRPARWGRPAGTLEQRLARARLVFLLERARGLGDWIALCLCLVAVGVILVVANAPAAEGRMRAPHLGIDYALSAVEATPAGEPATARLHGAGPALARSLSPGDLVAVETPAAAGWYRIERVEVLACRDEAPAGAGLFITTVCREDHQARAVILAWPVRLSEAGWI
jgi:hypothetical protein